MKALALILTITAYTPMDGGGQGIGAMGHPVRPGLTAAVSRDLRHLLGKEIYIKELGQFRFVNDLMHERWKMKVDIVLEDRADCVVFGVKKSIVEVVDAEAP